MFPFETATYPDSKFTVHAFYREDFGEYRTGRNAWTRISGSPVGGGALLVDDLPADFAEARGARPTKRPPLS